MFHVITLQQFVDGERSNGDQSADGRGVVGAGTGLSGRFSGNEIGKEAPVVGFGVRVPVPGRISGHELDIGLQEVVWIVATFIGYDGPHQYSCAVSVESNVASLHAVVVVPIGLIPEVPPTLENHRSDNFLSVIASLLLPG